MNYDVINIITNVGMIVLVTVIGSVLLNRCQRLQKCVELCVHAGFLDALCEDALSFEDASEHESVLSLLERVIYVTLSERCRFMLKDGTNNALSNAFALL